MSASSSHFLVVQVDRDLEDLIVCRPFFPDQLIAERFVSAILNDLLQFGLGVEKQIFVFQLLDQMLVNEIPGYGITSGIQVNSSN